MTMSASKSCTNFHEGQHVVIIATISLCFSVKAAVMCTIRDLLLAGTYLMTHPRTSPSSWNAAGLAKNAPRRMECQSARSPGSFGSFTMKIAAHRRVGARPHPRASSLSQSPTDVTDASTQHNAPEKHANNLRLPSMGATSTAGPAYSASCVSVPFCVSHSSAADDDEGAVSPAAAPTAPPVMRRFAACQPSRARPLSTLFNFRAPLQAPMCCV